MNRDDDYAWHGWFCAACDVECGSANREVDNFDLLCPNCGTAYVIRDGYLALPVGP